ncbi:MAG: hypothetical protein JNK79_02555 [Chitinophagaceae bacterium]|nr:hypothetical protein [Chitinophagaceae bacterium]
MLNGTDIFRNKEIDMNPNKALWEKGDFTRIADTMRESGTQFVSKLGITASMCVLEWKRRLAVHSRYFSKNYSAQAPINI